MGEIPGAESLRFTASIFSVGNEIEVQLSSEDFDQLLTAVERLKEEVASYPGTGDIEDSFQEGKQEMKLSLIHLATAISAVVFVYVYARFFAEKNLGNGLRYGFFIGLAWGVGMGYGTYAVMPLPYSLALGWFLGTLVEFIAAGLLVGLIVKDE